MGFEVSADVGLGLFFSRTCVERVAPSLHATHHVRISLPMRSVL